MAFVSIQRFFPYRITPVAPYSSLGIAAQANRIIRHYDGDDHAFKQEEEEERCPHLASIFGSSVALIVVHHHHSSSLQSSDSTTTSIKEIHHYNDHDEE